MTRYVAVLGCDGWAVARITKRGPYKVVASGLGEAQARAKARELTK